MPGIEMSNRPSGSVAVDAPATPASAVADFSQHVQSELEKVHYLSIQKNLERRLSVAREQGNQVLIGLLEQEQHQLAS